MILQELRATFGRLNRDMLTLAPGLNILHAPNEGGKSTWAGFLRAMLFGIDTRDRDKKGYLADKNRYQPWSGAPMEGEVRLHWQGRDMTLRRCPRGAVPFAAFSAVYTDTEEPVPGLTAATCGPLLVGAELEVYERSAFLGPNTSLSITPAPELERRIAALVSTGQEEISYSQVEGQLKEWLRRRKHNRTGLIPRLEEELESIVQTQCQLQEHTAQIRTLAQRQLELESLCHSLSEEAYIHRRLRQRELDTRYARAKEDLALAQEGVDRLVRENARFGTLPSRDTLKRAQGELQYLTALDGELRVGAQALDQAERALDQARQTAQDPRFPGLSGEEALSRAQQDTQRYAALETREQGIARRTWLVVALPLLLCAGLGAALLRLSGPVSAALLPLLGLLGLLPMRSNQAKCHQERAALLARYQVDKPQAMLEEVLAYQQRQQGVEQAVQHLRQVRFGVEERKARRETGCSDLLAFVRAFAPEVTDLFGCSAALSRALGLEGQLTLARERLEGAQRLHDALQQQGGRETATLEELASPARSPAETAAQLSAAREELQATQRALGQAEGAQQAVGDPALLAARQEELELELARRRQEYNAISAALEGLQGANARLQARFSPELNHRAGAFFSHLTGGRYQTLSLDRELEGAATESGGLLPRRGLSLSRGTVDQLYLAVRLAVCQLCLPQEDPAPLVLDDALLAFDDGRLELALDLLAQLGRERQILLFTCQRREGALMADRPDAHVVELEPGG